MNTKLTKIASVLAFIIGVMAIFAGGQVVLGKVMDYYVIDWLPIYNLTAGLVSALFTAVVIWKGSKIAMTAAIATFATHAVVMVVIQTAYQDVVASDSIKAMTVRMIFWVLILSLMMVEKKKNKNISN